MIKIKIRKMSIILVKILKFECKRKNSYIKQLYIKLGRKLERNWPDSFVHSCLDTDFCRLNERFPLWAWKIVSFAIKKKGCRRARFYHQGIQAALLGLVSTWITLLINRSESALQKAGFRNKTAGLFSGL